MTSRFPSTAIAGALLSSLALSACGSGDRPPAHADAGAIVPVKVTQVNRTTEPVTLDAAGTLVSRNQVDIASRASGRVTELPVQEGTVVKRGDLLVRVDAPELASAVSQAKAAETAAQTALEVAQRQDERMERLTAKEVVTPRDRELAALALRDAEAGLAGARSARETAEANMAYVAVRAPRDGVVVRRLVREGDLAVPGKPLLVMDGSGGSEVRVTLPAEASVTPRAGGKATVQFGDGVTVDGVVDRVEPGVDDHTRVAYVSLENTDRPNGTFVQVRLFGNGGQEALRLPPDSLIERGPLRGVFVVRDDRAVLRWLRIGEDHRVLAGLSEGDLVVLNPAAELRDGSPVEVAR